MLKLVRHVALFTLLLKTLDAPVQAAGTIELVSRAAEPATGRTALWVLASISGDGRYAVLVSHSPNVLIGQIDENQGEDVFLYDRETGEATLVSHVPGAPLRAANAPSSAPVISTNGEVIVFISRAGDLVAGFDGNDFGDVFLYHRPTGAVSLVSHVSGASTTAAGGVDAFFGPPSVSADGSLVAFASWATDLVAGQVDIPQTQDVFLYNRTTGTIALVSHVPDSAITAANVMSAYPVISADGEYVAFSSPATNLVAGQIDLFSFEDVFLYERATGNVSLVSHKADSPTVAANGGSGYSISGDGRFVAFTSTAGSLVAGQPDTSGHNNVFLYDRSSGLISLVSHRRGAPPGPAWLGDSRWPAISADGVLVAFASVAEALVEGQIDTEGTFDIFVYDHVSGEVSLVSHVAGQPTTAAGAFVGPPAISADGQVVAFESQPTTMVAGMVDANGGDDVFLYDRTSDSVSLVSHAQGSPLTTGDGESISPMVSADGSTVAFASYAGDLTAVTNPTDIGLRPFFFDRPTGVISQPTLPPGPPSATANARSQGVGPMSADGRFIAFSSVATNLIAGGSDDNRTFDAFLYDRATNEIMLLSHTPASPVTAGNGGYGGSWATDISEDGAFAVFVSASTDLVVGQNDSNGYRDVFLYERSSGLVTLVSHAAGDAHIAGNCGSDGGAISADGAFVAFISCATNLVAGQDGPMNYEDVYLYERATGLIRLVSHAASAPTTTASGSSFAPAISADGSRVAFQSSATNLVAGQYDTNGAFDVFLFDRGTGEVALVSHTPAGLATTGNGASAEPSIGRDGSTVVFRSFATDMVAGQVDGNNGCSHYFPACWGDDIFLYDANDRGVTLVSHRAGEPATTANRPSSEHVLSRDGRFVAFVSDATNLVAGQVDANSSDDVFLFDRSSGGVALVSHLPGSATTTASWTSYSPAISMDGSALAFLSQATDLVAGQVDGNNAWDVFFYRRGSGAVSLVSHVPGWPTTSGDWFSFSPSISADGRIVAFSSVADNLVAEDYNLEEDVFLSEAEAGPEPRQGRRPSRRLPRRP